MKTIIYLSMYIALTAFASCSKNPIDEEPAPAHPTARTFKVSLGAEAPGTRTSLNEETGAMSWVDGDAVSLHVVDKSGVVLQENRKFIYNAETHTFEGEFTSHPKLPTGRETGTPHANGTLTIRIPRTIRATPFSERFQPCN